MADQTWTLVLDLTEDDSRSDVDRLAAGRQVEITRAGLSCLLAAARIGMEGASEWVDEGAPEDAERALEALQSAL